MAILEKKQAIRKDIVKMGLLKKEGKNDYYQYQYLTANQLKAIFNKLFAKHGVEFDPTIEDVQFFEGTPNRPFGRLVKVRIYLYNVDNVKDYTEAVFYGESISNVQNGLYTAVTGAIKSYLENTFLTVSEDDPDATFNENVVNNPVEMTPEQKAILSGLPDPIKEGIQAKFGTLELTKRDASAVISRLKTEGKLTA